jgi:hypothetical protein
VALVGEWRNSCIGKPIGKSPFGWGGGIILKCMDRIHVVRDRDQLRDVTTIMTRGGSKNVGVFLD